MPVTLPPLSRRELLATGLVAGASLIFGRGVFADEIEVDPHRFALLSDTHIAADAKAAERGTVMADNLRRVVAEVVAIRPRPAAAIINGDCAYHEGKPADYALFLELIKPLREAGIPIHLTLGNHDDRANLLAAIPETIASTGLREQPVIDRRVTVIKTPRVQWVLLDTLDSTNKTPGKAGEKQLKWLGDALDATSDLNTIVVSHHQPDDRPKPSGLVDTKELIEVLVPRHQVKAHLFGHTHNWVQTVHDDFEGKLHQINLPPTAYVFAAGKPSGWVDCHIADMSATFELRSLDPKHPQHGQKIETTWRCNC